MLLTLFYMIGPIRGNNLPKKHARQSKIDWWMFKISPEPYGFIFLEHCRESELFHSEVQGLPLYHVLMKNDWKLIHTAGKNDEFKP